jgi:hypothetical protein
VEDKQPERVEEATSEPKEAYTRREMGRLRRKFITKENGIVKVCGHKFHPVNDPRTGCDSCWEAFFRVHEGVVAGIESILSTFGEKELVRARGTRFVKRYKWFVALCQEQQQYVDTSGKVLEESNA